MTTAVRSAIGNERARISALKARRLRGAGTRARSNDGGNPVARTFVRRRRSDRAWITTAARLRPATRADLPRIHQVRQGTLQDLLANPALVTDEEVVWALFVIDEAQGRRSLMRQRRRLRAAGHRQSFLTTGKGAKAEAFYNSKWRRPTGTNLAGETVFRLWL